MASNSRNPRSRRFERSWTFTDDLNPTEARIKKIPSKVAGGKTQTKFKVRCSRYLYTLSIDDPEKAEKLKQSLPPGASEYLSLLDLELTRFRPPPSINPNLSRRTHRNTTRSLRRRARQGRPQEEVITPPFYSSCYLVPTTHQYHARCYVPMPMIQSRSPTKIQLALDLYRSRKCFCLTAYMVPTRPSPDPDLPHPHLSNSPSIRSSIFAMF